MSRLYAALVFGLLISLGCNGTGDVQDTYTQKGDAHEVDNQDGDLQDFDQPDTDVQAPDNQDDDVQAPDNQDTDTDDLDVPDADAEGPDGEDADTQEPPPTVLKVMTFNIRTLFGDSDENEWLNRIELIEQMLTEENPMIIGTQESWPLQLEHMLERLPQYDWVGETRNGTEIEETNAIMFKRHLFELVESKTWSLSDTPEEQLVKISEEQFIPRIITWAKLRYVGNDQVYMFANTHWDYVAKDRIQERSAEITLKIIADVADGLPVILTGDFNIAAGSEAWKILVGELPNDKGVEFPLIDTWVEVGKEDVGTYHAFTGNTEGARIDWVLRSENGFLPTIETKVVTTSYDGRYPSDHFPVIAEVPFE